MDMGADGSLRKRLADALYKPLVPKRLFSEAVADKTAECGLADPVPSDEWRSFWIIVLLGRPNDVQTPVQRNVSDALFRIGGLK
jgi:hypothetical protein